MTDKLLLLKALNKVYIILSLERENGLEIIHCTLNKHISQTITGKFFDVVNAEEGIIKVIDLKNECVVRAKINDINGITYPGFPFEVSPVFILNPSHEDKITIEELFDFQKPAFEELKFIKSLQIEKNPENNYISNDIINRYSVVNSIHTHYFNQILNLDDKNLIKSDNIFKKYIDKLNPCKFPDKQLYVTTLNELEEFNNVNVSCRIKFYNSEIYKRLKEKHNLELHDLDVVDNDILSKCVDVWKETIAKYASDAAKILETERETFKTNNPDRTVEIEELDFVINVVNNVLNDVDFTKFKTPFELFCFWPPVLYPAPEFVIDPYV